MGRKSQAWTVSDLELNLWISRDTVHSGRVQHCCTPPREFGRISYPMGHWLLQRQPFSHNAHKAINGRNNGYTSHKLKYSMVIFLNFPWCLRWQWDAAGILAGLQEIWAAAHLPKTLEPEVTGETMRPQRDFGSLAQQLLGHRRRIRGAKVVCSQCMIVCLL